MPSPPSATLLWVVLGPVHAELVVKNVKSTVPVGVGPDPVTIALSCTTVPAATEVTTLCVGLWISVSTTTVSSGITLKLSVLAVPPPKSACMLTQTLYSPPVLVVSSYPWTVKPLLPVKRMADSTR